MESLAVLDLTAAGASCAQQLPQDIARTVRSAYGNDPHGFLPHMWLPQYDDACEKRDLKRVQKQQKAGTYLLQSVGSMNQRRSLVNWFLPQVDEVNEDEGQRAVRDTQDTVEVLLLRKCDDGIHLLPWVGDEHADVEKGSIVPTTVIPDDTVAKIAVQCAVRLPMGLCMPDRVDALIASLEEACADDVACWQDSPWLAGKLALFLHGDADGFVSDELCGYEIRYSRDTGFLEDEYGQPNVVVKERHKEQFKRGGATVTLVTAVFEGRLEVIDTKLFRDALCEGIGRAKGFGCGLLTIAPETRSNAE